MQKIALRVAGVIFLLVALLHLIRLFFKTEIIVSAIPAPLWGSGIAFGIMFVLALWMFFASSK